jgi:hypothetical protein
MSQIKKQINVVKNNWLIIVLFILLILFLSGFGSILNISNISTKSISGQYSENMYDSVSAMDSLGYRGGSEDSFAPEEETRQIIRNANINLETKKNKFDLAEENIKAIVLASDGYILSENVSVNQNNLKNGYYNVKVDSKKLDFITSQLKNVGKVKHYSETGSDVTGTYVNTENNLTLENQKLSRYKELYDSNNISYSDKINLIDKITYQERRVKSLEDSLDRLDQRIAYSTVSITLSETYGFAGISFFKFSELIKTLVNSINSLFFILFAVLPYAIAIAIIVCVIKKLKKKKKRK